MAEIFLIDSNSFITPKRSYYSFKRVPSYWTKLSGTFGGGRIVVLNKVRDEIKSGKDDLAIWLRGQSNVNVLDCDNDTDVCNQFSVVMGYVKTCGLYSSAAQSLWAGGVAGDIADPWLIASAIVYNYTIITFETRDKYLHSSSQRPNPKIPDVADYFHVKTRDLFYMMDQLGIGGI